jgi:hypothetical protein
MAPVYRDPFEQLQQELERMLDTAFSSSWARSRSRVCTPR